MEYPPAWRGYGTKEWKEHPDTAMRQAEVDAVNRKISDRFEIQKTLMPFEHKLPELLQGRNERLGDDEGQGVRQ